MRIDTHHHVWMLVRGDYGWLTPELAPIYRDFSISDVVDAFAPHKVGSNVIVMGGRMARSPLVRQIMADTTGLTVALPQTQEPVLLGAAMLGAVAGGAFASLGEMMASMSALGRLSEPTTPGMAEFHRTKRTVYNMLRDLDRETRKIMLRSGEGGR